jgi:hypothetical protein
VSLAARRRAARNAFVVGFLLHALAVLWLWARFEPGVRGSLLVYVDFPSALLYLAATREHLLAWSLVVGGLQWATITALLAMLVGRTSMRPGAPRDEAADDAD